MIAADRKRNGLIALAVAAALAAGALFRALNLTRDPLWLDEAYSAYAAAGGWHFLWHVVPRYETHPPFYYSLVRLWTLAFGNGLVALRSLGLAAGLLLMPAMWWAARGVARLTGSDGVRVPAMALAFAALAPGAIEMAREVRPYGVMTLVYALALGALVRACIPLDATRRLTRAPFALYCACLAAMLWLHSLGPLYGAALGLGALILFARRGLARGEWALFLGGHALAGLVYVPGLLILADQAPTWVQHTWLKFALGEGLLWTLALLWGAGGRPTLVAILLLAAIAVAALWHRPAGRRAAAALIVAAALPVAASIAISMTIAPVFIIRTMIPVGAPALLLLAVGWGAPAAWARWPALALGLLLLAKMISSDIDLRRFEEPKNDWYGALDWLTPRFRPGDVVLAYPNEGALPFDRAVRDRGLSMPSRAIPSPVPAFADVPGKWNPTGSRGVVSMSPPLLRPYANPPELARGHTVWLLRLGPWAYDKGDVFLHELSQSRSVVGHFRHGAIDIHGLHVLPSPSGERSGVGDAGSRAPGLARRAPPQPLP